MSLREPKQSQLDYLWVNFGERGVTTELPSPENPDAIPTIGLVLELLKDITKGVYSLGIKEKHGMYEIAGFNVDEELITKILFPIPVIKNLVKVEKYVLTQVEKDNEIGEVGDVVYRFELSSGEYLYAPIDVYTPGITDTITNEIIDGKIYSNVKFDSTSSIELTKTANSGLQANLKLDESPTNLDVNIVDGKGLYIALKWLESNELIKFKETTYNAYLLGEKENGTLYFLTDLQKVYLNGKVYPDTSGLQTAITQEISRAKEAENNLQNNIYDEEIARKEADSILEGKIDSTKEELESEINTEKERAETAEGVLDSKIDSIKEELEGTISSNKEELEDKISNEETARSEADTALDGKVEELNGIIKELQDKVTKLSMSSEEYSAIVVSELKKGGDHELLKDVKSLSGFTMTKETNLDLNGHSLEAVSNGNYGDNIVIGNGANVTISNGEVKPAEKSSVANGSATIMVKTAYESHLTLNNVKATGIHPIYLNSANENTTITINGGEYYTTMPLEGVSSDQMAPAVYVGKGSSGSTIGGKVTINSGTFGQKGVVNNFLLNVEDVLRKQEGKEPRNFIEVFGGKFWNFNPANNKAEGEGTNFVADGYTVKETQDGNDVIYEVIPV